MIRCRLRSRMIVRLGCRWTIVSLRRLCGTIVRSRLIHRWTIVRSGLARLRTIVRLWLRTIVPRRRLRVTLRPVIRRRLIHRRAIVRSRLIRLGTIVGLCRRRAIVPRWRLESTVGLRIIGRRTIVRTRLIGLRPCRLIGLRPCRLMRCSRRRRYGSRRCHHIHSPSRVHCSRRRHLRQLLACDRLARMLRQHLLSRRK